MKVRTSMSLGGLGAVLLFNSGCVVCGWGCCGSTVWTDPATEQLQIDTSGLEALEAQTHNGAIHFVGRPGSDAVVTVTKKGGGRTHGSAEEALQAIEVYANDEPGGVKRLGWKWRERKHPGWSAAVSFRIEAPGGLSFSAETHNGSVTVSGAESDVVVTTHNGGVNVLARGGKLSAETHNGRIEASYAGRELRLITHNGGVVASLAGCDGITGSIITHNGGVQVEVGGTTSAGLQARTHNGSIHCEVPLNQARFSRQVLTGTLGQGGGTLDVTTHNGTIRIKQVAG